MGRRSYHAKDVNHDDIVEAIVHECRLYFWDASQSNLGVDGFAVGRGRIVPVEFKHPKRLTLTPHEADVHAVLKRYGVTVEILTDTGASLDVLRSRCATTTDRTGDDMPMYLGNEVSDDYLQGLIAQYREGYGGSDEESDQPIIDKLAAGEVTTNPHALLLGQYDTLVEQQAQG